MNKLKAFPENILVLGLAKSGQAATRILLKYGKNVRVNDYEQADEQTVKQFTELGAEVITGSHPLSVLDDIDMIVKNPGIPYDNAIMVEAERREIPAVTEIELAYLLSNIPIIGVTGSNGKTTTVKLLDELLNSTTHSVAVAGNIGTVAVEAVEQLSTEDAFVLELSSFQLLGTQTFHPHIAVLLNIYGAHLDYHGTFAKYSLAKQCLFKNQTADDFLIYNADEKETTNVVQNAKATLIPFSISGTNKAGAWADERAIYFQEEKIINRREIVLVGEHNLENILAGISVAKLQGIPTSHIQNVLRQFSGVDHRLQFVTRKNDRLFYNDSKATNILATQKALASFKQPTILLAGGLDRGNEFTELAPYLSMVKAMVVFGETANKLKLLAKNEKIPKVYVEQHMDKAVQRAYQLSTEGDVILLSPACASWDQYKTFEERGDMFMNAVHKLS